MELKCWTSVIYIVDLDKVKHISKNLNNYKHAPQGFFKIMALNLVLTTDMFVLTVYSIYAFF